ncbi:MAG: leucine-rich repeat protein [Bacilli bacterium]
MEKKILLTLIASGFLVLSSGSFLVAKGIKDNKKVTNSSYSQNVLTESGVYFCANGGTLSHLGNYDSIDVSVTTFVAYSPYGDKYIDFSMERYIPTRSGYTFGGWFSSPNFESDTKLTGSIKVEDEIVKIYAYWKEEDKPNIYSYDLTTTYARVYGFDSSLYSSSNVYKLRIPSYIGGYPVLYISTSTDATPFSQPNVYEVILPEKLVYLYGNSFSNSNIEKISIPSSVTTIGTSAFSSCKVLKEVEISNKNSALLTISSYAFYNCESLETINIPSSVTTIGDSAFENCSSLENIDIPTSVVSIGKSILKGTKAENNLLTINDIVYINDSIAYEYKGSASEIVIPENTIVLANSLFEGKTDIVKVDFSLSIKLKRINNNVFKGCTSLTSDIKLPSSLESIGSYAFKEVPADIDASYCSFENDTLTSSCFEDAASKSIKIPYTIKTIKSYAFRNCKNLESITLPDSLITIESSVFNGCSSLKSIIVPQSVTSVYSSAFANCTSLISFSFPANITKIEQSLFQGCTSLRSVKLNSNITSISDLAFKDCINLKSLSIGLPSTFSYMGNRIFEGWNNDQTITFSGITEKQINEKNTPKEYTINEEKILCSWKYGCNASIKFI